MTNLSVKLDDDDGRGREVIMVPAADAVEKTEIFKAVLADRYDAETKTLKLNDLGSDIRLNKIGTWDPSATRRKGTDFFQGLMRLCQNESREIKAEKIKRITLANNELTNVTPIIDLATAFPDIHGLDLSNNKFKDLKALEAFRWKFKHLDWLFLSPNPIELEEPDYEQTIVHWFPTLRVLNTTVVRNNEAAADAAAKDGLPLTTIKDSFHDEGGIAESAIKQLISNMDADRSTLARSLYDDESTFSFSYNASAPRLETTQSTSWEPYLKQSRNLKKVTNLEPRIRRMAKGISEIESALKILPPTRHPDLVNDSLRYSFDCTPIPSVPDPLGRIESGVGGFKVDVHGQFEELDLRTGHRNATRSFDRVFILGPGVGENQLRIVSDILILRAEGGYEAFNPGNKTMPELPMVTANFGFPTSGKVEEQIKQAFVAGEIQKATGLTMEYAVICLKESNWNFQTALENFKVTKVGHSPLLLTFL